MSKKVAENTKRSKLNTKVNNLEKKISDATTLIHINQFSADKNVWKKKRDIDKKIPEVSGLVTTTVLITKILVQLRTKWQIMMV